MQQGQGQTPGHTARGTDTDTLLAALRVMTEAEPPRVWSVIVTIFGELAQSSDQGLSGAVLARLTGLMGIRPETMRVALHRLRQDGWIESRRRGRSSIYQLTVSGRSQTLAAAARIYGPAVPEPSGWVLVMGPPSEASETACTQALARFRNRRDRIQVAPNGVLVPRPNGSDVAVVAAELSGPQAAQMLIADLPCHRLPDWVSAQIAPKDLGARYEMLDDLLARVTAILGAEAFPASPESAALRALIVHEWRRLRLRHGDFPASAYPEAWRGDAVRARVHGLLEQIARADPDQLAAAVADAP